MIRAITASNNPVVYQPYFICRNQVNALQRHLERLGFASDEWADGIDATSRDGWLAVKDTKIHYVSEGWEERLAALNPKCSQQDLWYALGDASSRIEEIKEEIKNAVKSNPLSVRILPFATKIDLPSPIQGGEPVSLHWSAPQDWVRTFLPW